MNKISGVGHLIFINSNGAGIKISIELVPSQGISVQTFEVENHNQNTVECITHKYPSKLSKHYFIKN